jgi:uncharacterized protein (DUF433 family)
MTAFCFKGARGKSGISRGCPRNSFLAFLAKTWNHGGQEVAMPTTEKIDWSGCPLVEVKPRVHSGAPVLRATRMPANAIVDNFDYGVSSAEIAEQFEIPLAQVEAILTYAKSHRVAHRL